MRRRQFDRQTRRQQQEWRAMKRRRQKGPSGKDRRTVLASTGILFAAILLGLCWPSSKPTARPAPAMSGSADEFACQVSAVTDGDTLRCADGARIRLHAVAAREKDESCSPGHPCPAASGAAATAQLRELAAGQRLQCLATGRSYNRVTAICRNESGLEINCAMVQSGTTVLWPRYNEQRPICDRS